MVIERCSGCHTDGGISPFPLETYEQVTTFAPAVLVAIESGAMPPFLARETETCTPRLPWQQDTTFDEAEIALVRGWVDADTPLGDPATAAPIALPQPLVLEREDRVLALPEPITVDGDRDIHTCVIVDPQVTEDTYVTGRLLTPGNDEVLHHVVSYVVSPGTNPDGTPQDKADLEASIQAEQGVGIGERYDCFGGLALGGIATELLDAWAPGVAVNLSPENSGQRMPKDALVVLDVHYHPTGNGPEVDTDTTLSLMFADERPPLISQTILLGNFGGPFVDDAGLGDLVLQPGETNAEFLIPAGATDHVEEMTWEWILPAGFGLEVTGMGTHMHYVGRDMVVELEYADGATEDECLIQTPAWDFNWQRGYTYDGVRGELPTMRHGDTLRMRCTFDNSMSNPFLVDALEEQGLDAPVDVRLGEDTLDEMCLAAIQILYLNVE